MTETVKYSVKEGGDARQACLHPAPAIEGRQFHPKLIVVTSEVLISSKNPGVIQISSKGGKAEC